MYDSTYKIAEQIARQLGSEMCFDSTYKAVEEIARLKGVATPKGYAKFNLNYAGNISDSFDYSTGIITRKVGVVDLGELEWNTSKDSHNRFVSHSIADVIEVPTRKVNCSCNRFACKIDGEEYDETWDNVLYFSGHNIYIHCNRYKTVTEFKASMKGVKVYYELAAPYTEQLELIDLDWDSTFSILSAIAKKEGYVAVWDSSKQILDTLAGDNYLSSYDAALTFVSGGDIPEWMKHVSEATGIPVENLVKANSSYRFVDYLQNSGTQVIQLGNAGSNTTGMKVLYKRDHYAADSTFIGSREGATSATRYTMGARNNNPYYGAGQFAEFTTYNIEDGEQCSYSLNYLNNRRFVVNGDVVSSGIMTIPKQTWTISVFGYTRAGEPVGTSVATYVYNIEFTRGSDIESVYLPCINSAGAPIMLDLMTMTEYANQGTGDFDIGEVVSLRDKFIELGYYEEDEAMLLNEEPNEINEYEQE